MIVLVVQHVCVAVSKLGSRTPARIAAEVAVTLLRHALFFELALVVTLQEPLDEFPYFPCGRCVNVLTGINKTIPDVLRQPNYQLRIFYLVFLSHEYASVAIAGILLTAQ